MSNVQNTLVQRGERYGKFMDNASTAQQLKEIVRSAPKWNELEDDQAEALDFILSKIARMLSGDVNYIDNWHDIAGFAQLVENRLLGDEHPMTAPTSGSLSTLGLNVASEDPRPKAPLSATSMQVWDDYLTLLGAWNLRNPGMDV